jgi:hypothetical protein
VRWPDVDLPHEITMYLETWHHVPKGLFLISRSLEAGLAAALVVAGAGASSPGDDTSTAGLDGADLQRLHRDVGTLRGWELLNPGIDRLRVDVR